MAFCSHFLCSYRENHPSSKSGRDLDPDRLGCTMSCRGDVTDPTFSCFLSDFVLNSPTFVTDPRVIESVIGSAPIEHPHNKN